MDRQNAHETFDICIKSQTHPQRGLAQWQKRKLPSGKSSPPKWLLGMPFALAVALFGMMMLWGGEPQDIVAQITSKMKGPMAPLSTRKEDADAGLILLDIQTKQAAASFHVSEPGVYVLSVSRGSPAQKAGIHPGDCILQLNDKPVADATGLLTFLNHLTDGETASLMLRRGPDLVTVLFHAGAADEHA